MTLFLSRLSKCRDPALDAVNALLDPDNPGQRMDADHRLVWSLFAGDPGAERDFLWRAEGRRDLLLLSARQPGRSPFFEPAETRPFAPALEAGDKLGYALRVNATRARSGVGRVDIVMDALHGVDRGDRASRRMDLAQEVAVAWLAGQGARNGFTLIETSVQDYSVLSVPGRGRTKRASFGVLDLTGLLEVTDPTAFVARIGQGFGRAKAFGCGLMLIRRA